MIRSNITGDLMKQMLSVFLIVASIQNIVFANDFDTLARAALQGHIPSQKQLFQHYSANGDDINTYVWAHIYETNGIGDAIDTIEYLYTLDPDTTLKARNKMAQIFAAGYADYPFNEKLSIPLLPLFSPEANAAGTKELFLNAAAKGHIIANYILGHLYENGLLFDKDNQKARDHFTAAASKNHPMAHKHLKRITKKMSDR